MHACERGSKGFRAGEHKRMLRSTPVLSNIFTNPKDILALCTGLRPVVMVDYGGKLPELQQNLCSLLHLCHQESSILQQLKVMIIEEMIYLIHDQGLAEYVSSSLALHHQLLFVDLEQDHPKMVSLAEDNLLVAYVLGQLQDKAASVAFSHVLRDTFEHPMVRHEAAEALGSIAGIEGVEPRYRCCA